MARKDEISSNAVFDVFEDWESILTAEKINIPSLLKEAEFQRLANEKGRPEIAQNGRSTKARSKTKKTAEPRSQQSLRNGQPKLRGPSR